MKRVDKKWRDDVPKKTFRDALFLTKFVKIAWESAGARVPTRHLRPAARIVATILTLGT